MEPPEIITDAMHRQPKTGINHKLASKLRKKRRRLEQRMRKRREEEQRMCKAQSCCWYMIIISLCLMLIAIVFTHVATFNHHHQHGEPWSVYVEFGENGTAGINGTEILCEDVLAMRIYCLDRDGDGHGSYKSGKWHCKHGSARVFPPTLEYTLVCDDCDDTDPTIINKDC